MEAGNRNNKDRDCSRNREDDRCNSRNLIIYGGFKYISSGGDSGKVTEAKNTIIYAVIGLVVVALAQFIVQFVLNKVTNQ